MSLSFTRPEAALRALYIFWPRPALSLLSPPCRRSARALPVGRRRRIFTLLLLPLLSPRYTPSSSLSPSPAPGVVTHTHRRSHAPLRRSLPDLSICPIYRQDRNVNLVVVAPLIPSSESRRVRRSKLQVSRTPCSRPQTSCSAQLAVLRPFDHVLGRIVIVKYRPSVYPHLFRHVVPPPFSHSALSTRNCIGLGIPPHL